MVNLYITNLQTYWTLWDFPSQVGEFVAVLLDSVKQEGLKHCEILASDLRQVHSGSSHQDFHNLHFLLFEGIHDRSVSQMVPDVPVYPGVFHQNLHTLGSIASQTLHCYLSDGFVSGW